MKRFDFSKKHNISAVCFVVMMIILCILCFNIPIVHAEGEPEGVPIVTVRPDVRNRIITQQGYENSDTFDALAMPEAVLASDENGEVINPDMFDNDLSNGEAKIINESYSINVPNRDAQGYDVEEPVNISFSDNDFCYMWYNGGSSYTITCFKSIYDLPKPKYLVLSSDANVLSTEGSFVEYLNDYQNFSSNNPFIYCTYTGIFDDSGDVPTITFRKNNSSGITTQSEAFVADGVYHYYGSVGLGTYPNIFWASGPIWTVGHNTSFNSVLQVHGISSSGESLGDGATLYNVNYGNSGTDNGEGFPDGSGGDDSNNLYLENADFTFNHKDYHGPGYEYSGSVYPDGTIAFTALPNDYQKAHSEDFYLRYNFHVQLSIDYKNHSGEAIGPFKVTSSALDTKKNLQVIFSTGMMGDIEELSDFINNGNVNSRSFKDLYAQMSCSGIDGNLNEFLTSMKHLTYVDFKEYKIVCKAQLYNNTGLFSDPYSEWYNPLSKKGLTINDGMRTNSNPFVPDPSGQADDDPESTNITPSPGPNSQSATEQANNGQIIIYNTNNNNVNGGGYGTTGTGVSGTSEAGSFFNLFNPVKFFTNKLVGDNSTSGDEVMEETGVNGWFQVIASTYSFVPEEAWAPIILALTAMMGIIVVAFIIRIILDLL